MKEAFIYFNGVMIEKVMIEFVAPDYDSNGCTVLFIENDCKRKIVSVVPKDHLIVVKDDKKD